MTINAINTDLSLSINYEKNKSKVLLIFKLLLITINILSGVSNFTLYEADAAINFGQFPLVNFEQIDQKLYEISNYF